MNIQPISFLSKIQTTKIEQNKNNQSYSPNSLASDSISFSGKHFSNALLDKFLGILSEYKSFYTAEETAMQALQQKSSRKLNEINARITPLLKDEDLLWRIAPKQAREQYARFLVSPDNTPEIISKYNPVEAVMNAIRTNILTGKAEDILNELTQLGANLRNPKHIEILAKLKQLLSEKVKINRELEKDGLQLNMSSYKRAKELETAQVAIFSPFWSVRKQKDFMREVVHRAISLNSELKQIYSDTYKASFNANKRSGKIGKIKMEASEKANFKVLQYLKYGTTDESKIPF